MGEDRFGVAILGPTGYTGLELIEWLARHPRMSPTFLGSARETPPDLGEEFPRLLGRTGLNAGGGGSGGGVDLRCEPIDHDAIAERCQLVFLCLPHEAAMRHAPPLIERGVKVVDLSAAYRIKDAALYERVYGHPHTDPAGLERAVYGLTEWTRDRVRETDIVANPGCYPTVAGLALLPLLRAELIDPASIVINAASGASGAGRKVRGDLHIVEATENYSAYGVGVHRHQPEIAQTLRMQGQFPTSVRDPLFVPHLLPVRRGILETIYGEPTRDSVKAQHLIDALTARYEREHFVHVRERPPTLADVVGTNGVHLHVSLVGGRIVIIGTEDNLVKGASGQAIQNANLMLGLDETTGLLP